MHSACAYEFQSRAVGELQPTGAVGSDTSVPKAPCAAHRPCAVAPGSQHSPDTRVSLGREGEHSQVHPKPGEAAATFTPHSFYKPPALPAPE